MYKTLPGLPCSTAPWNRNIYRNMQMKHNTWKWTSLHPDVASFLFSQQLKNTDGHNACLNKQQASGVAIATGGWFMSLRRSYWRCERKQEKNPCEGVSSWQDYCLVLELFGPKESHVCCRTHTFTQCIHIPMEKNGISCAPNIPHWNFQLCSEALMWSC